jgi:hypothetical protein
MSVNAGDKMHRRAGAKMHHGWLGGRPRMRCTRSGGVTQTQLSSSINEPAFPSRPGITPGTARSVGDGRSGATRSASTWRGPDLPRREHRGRLTASRVLRPALALLALFEAIDRRSFRGCGRRVSADRAARRSTSRTQTRWAIRSNGRLLVTRVEPRSYGLGGFDRDLLNLRGRELG